MDCAELSEWMAYFQVEPFGEDRADLRAGIIASTVANTSPAKKKDRKPFSPKDFMPRFNPQSDPVKKQTLAEQFEAIKEIAQAFSVKPRKGPLE